MSKLILAFLCLLFAGFANALNDPMRPPFFDGSGQSSSDKKPVSALKLTMVLHAGNRQVAVVNGETVQVGESVAGYRVLSIKKDRVVVSHQGKLKELMLLKPEQRLKMKPANHSARDQE